MEQLEPASASRCEIERLFFQVSEQRGAGVPVDARTVSQLVGGHVRVSLNDSPRIRELNARGRHASAFYVMISRNRALIVAEWPCGTIKLYTVSAP